MSLLKKLGTIVDDCNIEYEYKMANPPLWTFTQRQEVGGSTEGAAAPETEQKAMSWPPAIMQPLWNGSFAKRTWLES